jgi:microcystin-dependent protein
MALDFPSNPTDGQVSGNYIWSATSGVWKAKAAVSTVGIPSPTAPTPANNGDVWLDTTMGISFMYYNDGTSSQWVEMLSSAVPSVNEIMPIGSIIQTARLSAPTGWLLCQGQSVSRTTYLGLFSAIGDTYGAGDGSTTFLIPNLQGRVPVGKASSGTFSSMSSSGGFETHTLTEAQMPSHTHSQASHGHTFSGTTNTTGAHSHTAYGALVNRGTGAVFRELTQASNGSSNVPTSSDGDHSHTYSGTTSSSSSTIGTTGSDSSHNNLQPYIVLNYMIKV